MDVNMLVLAASAGTFCNETKEVWQVVGRFLGVFKIVIPLLVMIFGMIDLGKAVVGSKDDEIKKSAKQLLFRVIAALCIYLIPTVIGFAFTLVDTDGNDYDLCSTCINHPDSC